MPYSTEKQNFFHPEHPVPGLSLMDGFNEIGGYEVRREGLGMLKVLYTPSNIPDAPVALVLHGYRGEPDGPNNKVLTDIMQRRGFATAQIGFAGYDHYGQRHMPQTPDTATVFSNIDDIKTVMQAVGGLSPIVVVCNSASINVALPAVSEISRVSHVLALSPVPDLVDHMVDYVNLSSSEKRLEDDGFIIPEQLPRAKITRTFLKAGQPLSLFDVEGLRQLPHKPRLMLARSEYDAAVVERVPGERNATFLKAASNAGFVVEDLTVSGNSHELTSEHQRAFEAQADIVAFDLGLRR